MQRFLIFISQLTNRLFGILYIKVFISFGFLALLKPSNNYTSKMKKFLLILSIILCSSLFSRIYASHCMGADLTFECTGPNSYLITLNVYRDCRGIALTGPMQVNYSSATCGVNSTITLTQQGPAIDITPVCLSNSDACNGGSGYGIQKYTFTGTLNLPAGCGADWVLSWTLCCRNAAITTLNNPGNDNLYIEANLNNTVTPCVSSPVFSNDPIAIYCVNYPQQFNHGAIAPNGDSLYYYLMPSLTGPGTPVAYNSPFSATNPLATTSGTTIDPNTGQLSFTPNATQTAVMKVGVNEYNSAGVLIAHVERDMQIIVTTCTNSAPYADGINGQTGANANIFTTTACSNFCFTIQTADASTTDSVFYTWVNNTMPGATISSSGGLKPLLTICWAPTQADVGTHNFVINLRNNDCPYFGTAAIAYTVIVNGASDPPVNAGPDVHLCPGQSTTLTATSTGTVTSYTWSDGTTTHAGATWTVSPAVTTIYTVTAAYANGCSLTDQVIVYKDIPPTVSAFPLLTTLCSTSDTVQLSAFSNDPTATFTWSPAAGLTCTTCANPKASPTATTTYSLVAVDSAGCPSTPVSVTVALAPPPPLQSCAVIYASPTGTGNGTQNSPASLQAAIDSAACNNALIKLAIGTYTIDNPITNITSYTTIEGGFDPANDWRKTSQPGATIIYRSALNMEGAGTNNERIVAIYMNGNNYFRFQDVTFQTANCPALAAGDTYGYSNYVLHLTNCSNYDLTRCQILPGTATGGLAGGVATGATPTGGTGGAGGGGAGTGCNKNGTAGTAGTAASSGAGGGAGGGGASGGGCNTAGCGVNASSGSNGSPGTAGVAGTNAPAAAPAAPGTTTTFFNVAGQSASGTNGTAGGGGGGGGGGQKGTDCTCSINGTCNGGAGGAGGGGGLAGLGGYGGGGCFGLYLFNNGAGSTIVDCNIAGNTAGTGGVGGTGQVATAATAGTAGTTTTGSCNPSASGGTGGAGGAGGSGGNGQPGAPGVSAEIVSNGTVPTYTAGGAPTTIVTGINNPTAFNLAGQTIIYAANINCTNRNDTLSSAASGTWTTGTGATVAGGTAAQIYTQYTTTGRKDIGYNGSTYTGFVNIAIDQTTFVPTIQSSAPVLNGDTFWVCQGTTANFEIQIASADTFQWNFGGATVPNTYIGHNVQNLTNLTFNTAGTFMILARIETSCCGWSPYDTAYILVEPNATLTYTGVTTFCPGDSAHVIVTGTGSSYSWAPTAGLSSSTGTNVYAFPQVTTSYLVTSYSPRGLCNADTSITITRDTQATISFNIIPAGCGSNGSITAVPTPAGAYTYSWSPGGANTATISNQPSGTYTVTVTPVGSSCTSSAATSLGTAGGLQAYFAKSISPLCNAACTGQVRVEAIGGVSPFTYHWSSSVSTLDSLNNLCAGTYDVTITDHNGCTASATQVLSQPLPLSVAVIDSTPPLCGGQCTGSAHVDGQGGTGPYNFVWSPSTIDSSHGVNLCAGFYHITVTDANNCTAAGGVTILTAPALIEDTVSTKDVTCNGANNGSIIVDVTGGKLPYTFIWPQALTITDSIGSPLAAGTYTPVVVDSNGCRDTFTVIITQPLLLTATVVFDSIACFGQTVDTATATAAGGTMPYSYALDGSAVYQASGMFTAMSAGAHTIHVKDANGCTTTVSFTIYQPTAISSSITSTTNILCNGLCTGVIVVAGAGGTPPYQYSINGGAWLASGTFNNLCANPSYTINVKDNNGCPAAALPDAITQPSAVSLTFVSATAPLCNNGTNGSFIVTASGGTPGGGTPYTYSANGGPFQASGTFSPEAAGSYLVTAKDGNGCTDTLTVVVPNPPASSTFDTAVTEVSCFGGNNGAIVLTVTGTVTPYTFAWSANAGGATTQNLSNLTAGLYIVTVTDGNGCPVAGPSNIPVTQPLLLTVSVIFDSITCFGQTADTATGSGSGGVMPYSYALDGSGVYQASGMFTALTVGPHTIDIQDANGCTASVPFTIYGPTAVTSSIVSTFNNLCFDSCNGIITVQGSGGVSPYEYSINGGALQTSPTFNNLCANPSYTINVQDAHGCPAPVLTDAITQPTAIVPQFVSAVQPTCNNGTNGSFVVTASGGTPGGVTPYTYSVDGGPFLANNGSFSPESAGNHLVTVMDGNGCTDTITVTVPNPPPSSTFTTVDANVTCFGGSDGSVTVTVLGTGAPYSFSWSPGGATSQNITNLTAGTYTVTITDVNGCIVYGADSVNVITQPIQISASNTVTPPSCFGGSNGCISVTPSGGVAPFTNSWTNGSTSSNPCVFAAGTYSDTLTDANGCIYVDANIVVTQPSQIAIFDSVTLVSCLGDNNGAIAVSDTGGTPGYSYAWSPGGSTSNPLTGIPVGSYTVTVTDANSCTSTATIIVGVDSPMILNATKSNVLCTPLQDGSITLTVTGGSPGYQYAWNNGATSSSLFNLNIGIDSVTITDSRGCTIDTGFVISNDSAYEIKIIPDTVTTINEGDDVQLALDIIKNGGGNPSSIVWIPSLWLNCSNCADPTATPLNTTQYLVQTVSDSGCTSNDSVLIIVIPQHQLYIPNAFTPNGDGVNDYWEAFGNKKVWVYLSVEVFDRWGEKVFESTDINYQWDGRYRGTLEEPGIYVYVFKVTFLDGYVVNNKGSITLIR